MKIVLQTVLALAVCSSAEKSWADTYQFYVPSTMPGMIGNDTNGDNLLQASEMNTNLNLIITNTNSKTAISTSFTAYLQKSASDAYSFGTNDYAEFNGTTFNRVFQEFRGNTLTIRENSAVDVRDKGSDQIAKTGDDGVQKTYDRVLELNVTTGAIISETLIAHTQADYDYAAANGHTVILENTGDLSGIAPVTMTTYAENITNAGSSAAVVTNGNFSTNQITASDGASLMRQEDDGTVHIGQNSIVLADELVSNSGFDQIYSSSNVLEIGNTSSHRTKITGALEIQDPTNHNHATNKRYVDGISAMASAVASMPQAAQGETMLTVGTGYRDGQNAYALGFTSRPTKSPVSFNVNAARSDGDSKTTFGAGLGWKF